MIVTTIVNLEMPQALSDFGTFNLKGMEKVVYRFEMLGGSPVLMPDFFVNKPGKEEFCKMEKHETTYKKLQALLTAAVEKMSGE